MSTDKNKCPFCEILTNDFENRIIDSNEHAFSIRDGFPISNGHTLVIPKRHIPSLFDSTEEELIALYQLLRISRDILDVEFNPDSYNIGINDGLEAGQTVPHLHIHLIPRYKGDQNDPRGGVRWIFPEKAAYWNDS